MYRSLQYIILISTYKDGTWTNCIKHTKAYEIQIENVCKTFKSQFERQIICLQTPLQPYVIDNETPDVSQGVDSSRCGKWTSRTTDQTTTRKNLGILGAKIIIMIFLIQHVGCILWTGEQTDTLPGHQHFPLSDSPEIYLCMWGGRRSLLPIVRRGKWATNPAMRSDAHAVYAFHLRYMHKPQVSMCTSNIL